MSTMKFLIITERSTDTTKIEINHFADCFGQILLKIVSSITQ